LVNDDLPSPYSYNEFKEFLKKDMCEENLEFLSLGYKYQQSSASLYPIPWGNQNEPAPPPVKPQYMANEEFESRLSKDLEMLTQLVNCYIKPDSEREVNLPVNCRKPFFKLYYEGFTHPDILDDCLKHIQNMLRLNSLNKFLKAGYDKIDKTDKKSTAKGRTIKEVVLNELPPPFTTHDFLTYLKKEVAFN
jgi:hypothetical protein